MTRVKEHCVEKFMDIVVKMVTETVDDEGMEHCDDKVHEAL